MGLFSRDQGADDSPETAVGAPPPVAGAVARVEVTATDGPMPETREAFQAIRDGGGTTVDVALVNTQLVEDQEILELVELEIRDLASNAGLTIRKIERL